MDNSMFGKLIETKRKSGWVWEYLITIKFTKQALPWGPIELNLEKLSVKNIPGDTLQLSGLLKSLS